MIVLTTPTGDIGHQVLERVLERGQTVRVIARKPFDLPPETRARVEVIEGSHGEAGVVDEAFKGAETVFWLVPPNPHAASLGAAYLDFTRPACAAIQRRGVKRVVTVSALGRGTEFADRAGFVTASLKMEDLIAETGVHFRALVMPSFMDNMLRQVNSIAKQGAFFSPLDGDRKLPTCATRDIAAAAVELLLNDSWTGQARVPVLGPEDLSANDMAAIMSQVLGQPVRFQRISFEAFTNRLQKNGMSAAFIEGYAEMMQAKNEGMDNAEARTEESGSPTSFRQWCEEILKPAVAKAEEKR